MATSVISAGLTIATNGDEARSWRRAIRGFTTA
jgi:hypothetical protein